MELQEAVFFLVILLVCGTIHEFAHAWTATRLGDRTPAAMGRLTLNPIVHIDIIGSLVFPVLMLLSRSPLLFAWMKPVPVAPWNFRHPRRDLMLVALAGPVSNVLIATLCALVMYALVFGGVLDREIIVRALTLRTPRPGTEQLAAMAYNLAQAMQINLLLAGFNLVPIHPLDGSKILGGLLPRSQAEAYDQLAPYGFMLLLAFMFLGGFGLVNRWFISPGMDLLLGFL